MQTALGEIELLPARTLRTGILKGHACRLRPIDNEERPVEGVRLAIGADETKRVGTLLPPSNEVDTTSF